MTEFTTMVHVTSSTYELDDNLEYIEAIIKAVYASHATVLGDWLSAAVSRSKRGRTDDDTDWEAILNSNLDAIKKSDLVIVEASQARFSQGFQAYIAAQYKKPTLIVARTETKEQFISGVGSKLITIKQYSTVNELQAIVAKFIKQNLIPDKDLRFNMILDRRIYKYLRDASYDTGRNKSQIVRSLLENEMEKRK